MSDYEEEVEFVCRDGSIEGKTLRWCVDNGYTELQHGVWSGPWYGNKSDDDDDNSPDAVMQENTEEKDLVVEKATAASSTTCHSLPCTIEYTGKAPVYLYFQPETLTNPAEQADDGAHDADDTTKPAMQAAQFRGRGLLAPAATTTSTTSDANATKPAVHGRLLNISSSTSSSNNANTTVSVQAHFDTLTDWHHEHQPAAVLQALQLNNRSQTATDWFPVASALHAPIPVPIE